MTTHFSSLERHLALDAYQIVISRLQNQNRLNLVIGFLSIIAILMLSNLVLQHSFSSEIISYGNNGTVRSNCSCVVFRMDDIQDYWVRSAQLAAMNQFTERNQSLTLGIIMSIIGNDTEIVNKVREGYDSGLFELAVHGWNHTDYTKLSAEEQRTSMYDANRKMSALFGNASEIFIPPLNSFNNDTINAIQQVGMKIINANSSSFDELQLNESSSNNNNNNESQTLSSLSIQSNKFFYVPSTIAFKDYYQDKPIKNSIQNIFNNVTQSVSAYGYAVVIFHPQDFVKIDANGSLTDDLDENEIDDLSRLIDLILSNNIRIGSFSDIIAESESIERIMPTSILASPGNIVNEPEIISTGNPTYDQFDSYIINASNLYGIPDKLMVKSMIMQESHFDNFLISWDSPCGVPNGWTEQESKSFGLTQVTPACGEVGGTRPNLTTDANSPNWATSLFNPEFNINQGVTELSENLSLMKNRFPECTNEQHMLMALGAYNSGENAIQGCNSWNERANNYINSVTERYRTLSQLVNNLPPN
jgi:peptidoglycan/xylan/chitin deacetylase (PgdA/CDA1 family)